MSIVLKQFNNSQVNPVDDARLYNFMLAGKIGIAEGMQVSFISANQLRVSAGWGICQGRMFEAEEEIVLVKTSASGKVNGRLLIEFNTAAETPVKFISQAQTPLPSLIQQDINNNEGVYQIPLASYQVDELSVSGLKDERPFISDYTLSTAEKIPFWISYTDSEGKESEEPYIHFGETSLTVQNIPSAEEAQF